MDFLKAFQEVSEYFPWVSDALQGRFQGFRSIPALHGVCGGFMGPTVLENT